MRGRGSRANWTTARAGTFAAALALVLLAAAAAAETRTDCIDDVCLHLSQSFDRVEIEVSNGEPVPIGVRLEFERLDNLVALPSRRPPRALVPPGARAPVVTLIRENASQGASYPFQWQWVWGDPGAAHDPDARYRMPFGGTEPRVLTQGVGGRFSHAGATKYAFDWAMPVGTPILAARAGTVVDVADGYTRAGTARDFLREANAVTVMHEDGTFATYAHLDPGAGVRPGMRIFAGEVLGFSGNTGFSTGPHLHFAVWKAAFDGGTGTLPVRFRDRSSSGFVPQERVAYAPGCHAEGVPCVPGDRPQSFPASRGGAAAKTEDGSCQCRNGAVITTHLPCRMVCP